MDRDRAVSTSRRWNGRELRWVGKIDAVATFLGPPRVERSLAPTDLCGPQAIDLLGQHRRDDESIVLLDQRRGSPHRKLVDERRLLTGGPRKALHPERLREAVHVRSPLLGIEVDHGAAHCPARFGSQSLRRSAGFRPVRREAPLDLAVVGAELRHVCRVRVDGVRPLGLPPERAVKALVARVPVARQPVHQHRPRQALGDQGRVVVEGREQISQPSWAPGLSRHAVHLGLELFTVQGARPEAFERRALAEGIRYALPDHRAGEHLLERRLGAGVLLGPAAVPPVDLLDPPLVPDALLEAQRSVRCRGRSLQASLMVDTIFVHSGPQHEADRQSRHAELGEPSKNNEGERSNDRATHDDPPIREEIDPRWGGPWIDCPRLSSSGRPPRVRYVGIRPASTGMFWRAA